ncbi:hypothetical protein Hanom_Chr17g01564211 [Helianthus anomalus]
MVVNKFGSLFICIIHIFKHGYKNIFIFLCFGDQQFFSNQVQKMLRIQKMIQIQKMLRKDATSSKRCSRSG